MKLEKIYSEIKEYETHDTYDNLDNEGDLYVQNTNQLFKHFLDRIKYRLEEKYIIIFSPKLNKTFIIPDENIKDLSPIAEYSDLSFTFPGYSFGYPISLNNINDEYVWNDGELSFYMEKIK